MEEIFFLKTEISFQRCRQSFPRYRLRSLGQQKKLSASLERGRIRWHRKNLFRILGETSNNRRKSRAAWEVFSMHYASERTARKKFSVVWDFLNADNT